jgi:hypothetical protein
MTGNDSAAVDQAAASGYPRMMPPPATWLPHAGTRPPGDALPETPYTEWRRQRYSWLYEDDDIWASL